jgi:hypothetical protein
VCTKVSDLSPLARLTALQFLKLSHFLQLSDLSPLAGLTSLQTLKVDDCLGVRRFASLESLLPTLEELSLFACKFDDLPQEVCGEYWEENVLDKVRAHYEDLKSGQQIDAEVKVLFFGNGGVGKPTRKAHSLPVNLRCGSRTSCNAVRIQTRWAKITRSPVCTPRPTAGSAHFGACCLAQVKLDLKG